MDPFGGQINLQFLHVFEENEMRRRMHLEYRVLRDTSNPFSINEENFQKLYRLPKGVVQDVIIPQIQNHMRHGVRSTCIPTHIKVLATLHFLAQGSYQSSLGKDLNIALSQSAVSRSMKEVLEIMAHHLFPVYIKFPTRGNEQNKIKRGFLEKFEFPNVVGAIDCTHIAIIAPPENDPHHPGIAYLNRKGYYSVNVQVICDSDLKILGANARYPGSTHDAAIWTMSSINRYMRRNFERGDHTTWLLGDSGYALKPWLLTPLPDAPDGSPEARYTLMLCRARNVIERCFGVLKQRFRCLLKHRVLHYSHAIAALIFYSCCVLHNICVERNLLNYGDAEEFYEEDDVNANQEMDEIDLPQDILAAGRRIQNRLIAELNRI